MVSAEQRHDRCEFVFSAHRSDPDFIELLPIFVDELPEKRATLRALGISSEFDAIRREAHKLRGSAGGYGFDGLSDLAGRLEDSCKNPARDETSILRTLDELVEYLGKVRA